MEAQLLRGYGKTDNVTVQRMSWLAKGMAMSGREKYRRTLEKVAAEAASDTLKKHTNKALKRLGNYQRWNPIISRGLKHVAAGDLERKRILNMLYAKESELIRVGAKRIYFSHWGDGKLQKAAKDKLLQDYKISDLDAVHTDALAYLIKVLSKSGKSSYKAALEEVAANSGNKKLVKYAKKYASRM